MLRWLVLVSGLVMMGYAADAPPLPQVVGETVEEGSLIRVRNVASQPLTAVLVEMVDYPGSRFRLVRNEAKSPIPPGEERKYTVSSLMPGTAPDYLKATAALYADGSAAGPAEKVAELKNLSR